MNENISHFEKVFFFLNKPIQKHFKFKGKKQKNPNKISKDQVFNLYLSWLLMVLFSVVLCHTIGFDMDQTWPIDGHFVYKY